MNDWFEARLILRVTERKLLRFLKLEMELVIWRLYNTYTMAFYNGFLVISYLVS